MSPTRPIRRRRSSRREVTAGQIRSRLGGPDPPGRDPTRPRRPGPRRAVRPRGGHRRRGRPVHRLRHHHRHRPHRPARARSPTSSSAPARPSCGCAACAAPRPAGSPPPSASGSTPPTPPPLTAAAPRRGPLAALRHRATRRPRKTSGRTRAHPTSPRRHPPDRPPPERHPPERHRRASPRCGGAARSGGRASRPAGAPGRGGGRSAAGAGPGTSRPGPATPAPPASCAGCSRSRSPPARRWSGFRSGRHLHTAEPVGLDPAAWLRTGLVSNTGVWVQGQPGIGKSSITKRLLTGLVGYGMAAVIPGDVKGEYTPLIEALGGAVWRIGRGRHALNPLDAGPLQLAQHAATGSDRRAARRDHPRPPAVPARSPDHHRAPRRDHRHRTPPARRRPRHSPSTRPPPWRIGLGPAGQPVIPDVLTALAAGSPALREIAAAADDPTTGARPGSWSTPSGCCARARSAGCSTARPPSPPTRTPPRCRWTSPRSTTMTTTSSPRRCCAPGPGRPA